MFVSRAEEAGAAAITKLMCNVCDRRGVEAEADHALERISGTTCLVLEHEVAGIEQMKLNLRKVAFVRMRTVWE
jgi:CTP:molybdopterin cytidylyltransferase MocA